MKAALNHTPIYIKIPGTNLSMLSKLLLQKCTFPFQIFSTTLKILCKIFGINFGKNILLLDVHNTHEEKKPSSTKECASSSSSTIVNKINFILLQFLVSSI